MSVKLTIAVPDVNAQITDGFDFIRVFRSTVGAQGPFTEITAESPEPATLVGTEIGPFNVSGQALLMRVNRGPTQSFTLAGGNPLSASQIAAQIITAVAGTTAVDDGSGRLKISTTGTGTDEILEILGEADALAALGFAVGQFDIGEAARIPLVEDITDYLFEDVAGSADDFYEIDFVNSSTNDTSAKSDPVQGALVETVAKQQADTRAPRGLTILRKTSHVFREAFFKDVGNTVPMIPLDASKYPSFQVVNINGQITSAGLATVDGTPGNYRVEVFIPVDAPISNDDRRWRIEWVFIDEDNRQLEKTTEFDVRDLDITATEVRDLKLLALCNKPLRVFIRELKRPSSLRLDVVDANNENVILVENALYPGSGTAGELLIEEVTDNETFVYQFTIPKDLLKANCVFRADWQITPTIASPAEFAFQIIEVPIAKVLQFFPALRMVIDKYQKRREIIQAYQDSDIHEYLVRGLQFVNAWHPLTSYNFTSLPDQLVPFWLLAGQMWGLNAQFLLETDLQFNFSGQTVTLDYDHTANLDTAIQRATDWITESLTAAKTPLLRRASGVGVMAGKPIRLSGLHNHTFKINSFGSNDLLTTLSNFGLL